MAPELPQRDRRHPARREAARDHVPRRRLAPDAGVRRSLRDPADHPVRHPSRLRHQPAGRDRARRSQQGFEYNSGNNPHFLSVERSREACNARCRRMIPYGRQDITAERHRGRRRGPALGLPDAGTGGAALRAGGRRAIAAPRMRWRSNSATSALHIACLALGLGPGDLLWTSPNTFVASANCGAVLRRATSISSTSTRAPATWMPAALAAKLEQRRARTARLPKVVVPVHFAGQAADMAAIGALAQRYGFRSDRGCVATRSAAAIADAAGRRLRAQRHHACSASTRSRS